jgi:hypothetical protein
MGTYGNTGIYRSRKAMTKSIVAGISAIFSSITTWYAASFYYMNSNTYTAERIITSEIALLEMTKEFPPPCDRISTSSMTPIVNDDNSVTVWKTSEDQLHIEKFVLNNDFDSAYEQVTNTCAGN